MCVARIGYIPHLRGEHRKAGTAERWLVDRLGGKEMVEGCHMLGVGGMRAVKMGISMAQLPT